MCSGTNLFLWSWVLVSLQSCYIVGLLLNASIGKKEQGSHRPLIMSWPTADDFMNRVYHPISDPITHPSPFSFLLLLNGRLSSYQSFLDILNETNDYAGQRELIAENMMMNICIDLTKYLQELKQERKTVRIQWNIRLVELHFCSCEYNN